MTLKEDFRMANMVDNGLTILEKYEKIAEEFAVEYAEWCCARAIGVTYFKLNEEELEQFKKEKGL
jgi:hypothetical protein